jgi:phage tail sheath gpL-like
MEQHPGVGVAAIDGVLATVTTLASGRNSGRLLVAYLRGTRSPSYEIAAAMGAVLAGEEDPARPLNTLELVGINAPPVTSRFTRTEQESCLYNGTTPLEVGPGERVQIVRAVSTYIHDANAIDDISLLDITTIRTLDYVRKAIRERIALRFPREKLSTKTGPRVKTEIMDVLTKLQDLEIIEEVEANKPGVIVERDLQDPNRLNAKIPADVVNGLHIFAGRIDLLL